MTAAKAAGGANPKPVAYLYASIYCTVQRAASVVQLQITRKTPRRVYYRHGYKEYCIDRQQLEANGGVEIYKTGAYNLPPYIIWTSREDAERVNRTRKQAKGDPTSIQKLKAAMAAAHPDRGGNRKHSSRPTKPMRVREDKDALLP